MMMNLAASIVAIVANLVIIVSSDAAADTIVAADFDKK